MRSTALITGSTGGIGRATVAALLEAGFDVWAGVRRAEDASQDHRPGAHRVLLDVTDDHSMQSAVATVERSAPIDVLVNNAGIAIAGPLEELDLGLVRHQLEVNVVGVLRMTQLVLPGMRAAGRGRIVIVGSVGGLFAAPGAGGYHMSKYAIEAFADVLRAEVRPFGIGVVLLEPTGVRTDFVERQLATMPDSGPLSPYAPFKAAMARSVRALFDERSRAVVAPEAVARVIVRASTTRSPRTRYRVGALAHVTPPLRRLVGDRGWDALMRRQLREVGGTGADRV